MVPRAASTSSAPRLRLTWRMRFGGRSISRFRSGRAVERAWVCQHSGRPAMNEVVREGVPRAGASTRGHVERIEDVLAPTLVHARLGEAPHEEGAVALVVALEVPHPLARRQWQLLEGG